MQDDTANHSIRLNRSVQRVILLMRSLADNGQPMTLTEVVNVTRLPDSTVYRLLRTLELEGIVERAIDGSGRYQLGLEMFRLGSKVLERLGFGPQILPDLEDLAAKTGETVNLGVLKGFHVLYLQKVESLQPLRASLTVGSASVPAYCSSTGKMMLSSLLPDVLDSLLSMHSLDPMGPNTITDRSKLLMELQRIRERGFAIDDLEFACDIRSVAAPIRNHHGVVVAALAVAGPSSRLPLEGADAMATQVVETADRISSRLGYVDTPRDAFIRI